MVLRAPNSVRSMRCFKMENMHHLLSEPQHLLLLHLVGPCHTLPFIKTSPGQNNSGCFVPQVLEYVLLFSQGRGRVERTGTLQGQKPPKPPAKCLNVLRTRGDPDPPPCVTVPTSVVVRTL